MTMKPGLRRFPALTLVVFGVTLVVNVTQLSVRGMQAHIERAPSGLHGDWWRTFTALFGQDGGVAGTVSNLIFLVVIGALAEQVLARPRWLLSYFATGLVGELVGYAWQPHGAGDSVAICGLAGAVAVASWRGERLPTYAPMFLVFWCGALLSGLWYPLFLIGIVAGVPVRLAAERGLPVTRPAAATVLVAGAALAVARDIHGAALLTGLALAALLALTARRGVGAGRTREATVVGVRPAGEDGGS